MGEISVSNLVAHLSNVHYMVAVHERQNLLLIKRPVLGHLTNEDEGDPGPQCHLHCKVLPLVGIDACRIRGVSLSADARSRKNVAGERIVDNTITTEWANLLHQLPTVVPAEADEVRVRLLAIPLPLRHPFGSDDREVDSVHHRYPLRLSEFTTDIEQGGAAHVSVDNVDGMTGIKLCFHPLDTLGRIKQLDLVMPRLSELLSPFSSLDNDVNRTWHC